MTTQTTDTRIAARRAALTKQRAERKDELDLPRTLTMRQVREYASETAQLDATIAGFEAKAAAWAALPSLEPDATWLAHLTTWRTTLCDELMTIKSPIRDREVKQRADSLTFSIKLIDFGLGINRLPEPIIDLRHLRLGELMELAGYATFGEALRTPRGWRGSLPEVGQRIKALTAQRAAAEAALDALLLTDEERAKVEAESQAHRDALNTMDLKGNADGTGLVAFTKDSDPLDVAAMTEVQRKAFEWFSRAHNPREPVTS